jgi:predicted dehydrogenase/threonine dehydrogenase-like Zn-dependent dehydrogenase
LDRVACAGQGHAEVIQVSKNLAAPVPDGVSADSAAFATVGAIALHGLRLSEARLGEHVAVIGLGLIGLLMVQLAKASGLAVTGIDLNATRVALALELGADYALTIGGEVDAATAVMTETRGRGADAVLITASTPSSDPVEMAADLSRDRGRVVAVGAVGMDIPRRAFFEKELEFRVSRSYGPGRYDPDYEERGRDYPVGYVRWTEQRNLSSFLDLVGSGAVRTEPLITHRSTIADAASVYELISGPESGKALGVVLSYPESPHQGTRTHTVQPDRTAPTSGEIGLGLVGAGLFATRTLLPAIRRAGGFRHVGVCTASGASARHAADKFDFAYATTDFDRVVTDRETQVVAIATRHGVHADQVVRALEAGRHVFVEKPLCLSKEELRAVVRAVAEARDRQLMVGFNRRFAPMAQRLRTFFQGHAEPVVIQYRVNAGFIPKDHWIHDPEIGGGRIVGEACHFLDFVSFVADSPPRRVRATPLRAGPRYTDDNAVLVVELANGSLATISYLANGDPGLGKERCEVSAGGRSAVLDDFRSLVLYEGGAAHRERNRLTQDKGHRGEWTAFAQSIRNGGPWPISLESLVATTLASFAAAESLRSGDDVPVDVAAFLGAAAAGKPGGVIDA